MLGCGTWPTTGSRRSDEAGAGEVLPVLVDEDRVGGEGGQLIGDERQFAVLDPDPGGGPAGGLRVVGGDDGDRFAVVADLAVGEDGGVLDLQAVVLHVRRQIVVRHHGVDAGGGEGLTGVDRHDLGVGDGGAQNVAPQHVLVPHVGGVRELAGDLEGAVGAEGGLADTALGARALGECGGNTVGRHGQTSSDPRAAARRTASMIFS
ncbi:hypothetical protein SHKM778_30610 [Streptomyces sp. KM77-8]|uniref:Uncharacterized protein n=1 Tax=Streptomyces haneummycinicus TaxID=3074435 RepID=A0AAT9HGR4_9ACTN